MRILLGVALFIFIACPYSAFAQDIKINEIVASNATVNSDEDGDHEDWLELFNAGQSELALSGYGLSDDAEEPFKWLIPDVSLAAGGHLLIWASGKDRAVPGTALHANFSIKADGEVIILTGPGGEVIDQISPIHIPTDKSYGRSPNGSSTFTFFSQPSPGSANDETGYESILANPTFSHEGGFYSSAFNLTISSGDSEATIIYTLDGSEPDPENTAGTSYTYKNQYAEHSGNSTGELISSSFNSAEYSSPLWIGQGSQEENHLSHISSTFHRNPYYFPEDPVSKGTVVKAMAIKPGALPSEVVTNSFFVNPDKRYSLPVVSISMQEDHLFDYEKGIYLAGKDFDDWRSNNHGNADGGTPANYHRRGEEAEYPAHIEVFEGLQGRVLSQNIGLRMHGGWSRSHPAKSLRLYARNEYGDTHMRHSFFPDQPFSAYKRLILRNSGNDWGITLFRDAALQAMVSHMSFDTQASRPAVLFLNGEYWGIQTFRERFDKYYLERTYGVDPENIDLFTGNMWADQGDNHHYKETIAYIEENGLSGEEHYSYLKTRIDVENFMDYQLSQIFMGNTDWPGNNIKAWRTRTTEYQEGAAAGKDGRWRWLMYDTDFGFGIYNKEAYTEDILSFATDPNGPDWPNPSWSTFLLRKLLENNTFRNDFINRFSDQLNTAFRPDIVKAKINSMMQEIEPEMAEHIQRWKSPENLSRWQENVNVMLNFADQRPAYQRTHLRDYFELGDDYQLQVAVSDARHGFIKVNSLALRQGTVGLPEEIYPWTGNYFQGTTLTLEAIPAPGYVFVGWEGSSSSASEKLVLDPGGNLSLTAVFERQQNQQQLIHYWNFNAPDKLLEASYTLREGTLKTKVDEGASTEVSSGTGNGFRAENTWFEQEAGSHLRINNPLGSELVYTLPTTGFSDISFQYESRRSGQGSEIQRIAYSLDGSSFIEKEAIQVLDEDPIVYTIDFSGIEGVNNNPNFSISIKFEAGEGSTAGNNRFDNVTISGLAQEGTKLPPLVIKNVEIQNFIEHEGEREMDISQVFEHPQEEAFTLSVTNTMPGIAEALLSGETLILKPLKRGETLVTLSADDGVNPLVSTSFRVMVYPEAFSLATANFQFSAWDATQPEMSFPEHMLFLQSNTGDPAAGDPLPHAYFIPHDDYHEEDEAQVGFPYQVSKRSRINGLEEEGISFINTGRDRDLGGVLLALDTRGLEGFGLSWLNGTILQNERFYGMRLQYRYSVQEPFKGMVIEGKMPEYKAQTNGHTEFSAPLSLPAEFMDQEYLQLLWRYHHISGKSGPRAELRLDDIIVAENPGIPIFTSPVPHGPITEEVKFEWNASDKATAYHLQLAGDEEFREIIYQQDDISTLTTTLNGTNLGSSSYARLRAKNSIAYGKWSEPLAFTSLVNGIDNANNQGIVMESFPNPFTHETNLKVSLQEQNQLRISLHDLSGKVHAEIETGKLNQGSHNFKLNTRKLAAGVYIIICQFENLQLQQKIVKY